MPGMLWLSAISLAACCVVFVQAWRTPSRVGWRTSQRWPTGRPPSRWAGTFTISTPVGRWRMVRASILVHFTTGMSSPRLVVDSTVPPLPLQCNTVALTGLWGYSRSMTEMSPQAAATTVLEAYERLNTGRWIRLADIMDAGRLRDADP